VVLRCLGELLEVGDTMVIKYDENKSVTENNTKILTEISNCDFSLMNEDALVILADSLFKLFKCNFESGNYSAMNEISHYCKSVVDSCIDRKLYSKKYCGETIVDIACFVFEQMCMYEDKVLCLKTIIHSHDTDEGLKIRALEEIMCPEPGVQSLIKEETDVFSAMLQQLTE